MPTTVSTEGQTSAYAAFIYTRYKKLPSQLTAKEATEANTAWNESQGKTSNNGMTYNT